MARYAHAEDSSQASAVPTTPYRWAVLAGVWLVYATFGMTVVSLAPLAHALSRDLGVGHGSLGLVFGAWQLMFILSAVPCGALLDRIGARAGLLVGALVIALSGLLRSWAPDYWTLLLAVAVFGLGGPIVSTGAPKIVTRWFRGQERGFAMGLYITGPAVGSMCALSLTNSMLMPAFGDDWRAVLRVWALVALVAGAVWLAITAHPAMRAGDEGAAPHGRPRQRQVIAQLIAIPGVQLLLLMSVGIFLFNHALNNWLPEMLRAKGMSSTAAGYWATVPTLVGLVGSLTIPRLATPRRRHLMLIGLFVAALLASLLLQAGQGALLAIGLVLQGIARSSMMTIAMLTLVETPGIGERHAAMASGLFFSAAEIGGASGPVLVGLVHDIGGFEAGLAFLSLVALSMIAAALRLQRLARAERAAPASPPA